MYMRNAPFRSAPLVNVTRALPAASRRTILKGLGAVAGALVLGTHVGSRSGALAQGINPPAMPNAFVKIAADDSVTVIIKHLDKGQGVTTGLTTLVAEELDADWAQMRVAFAPADARLYNNLFWGPAQGTGGSTAMANSWLQLRKAGAAARAMLVSAAAAEWNVPASEIMVERGVIRHDRSGRNARFGALAAKAAALPVPAEPMLKDPKDWTLIGTRVPRIDSADKTSGKTIYALDIRRPGMLTAVVAHAPRFGATVKSFDAAPAKAVKGVVDVVQIPTGVAVLARDTWSAMKGREALTVEWNDEKAERRSSDAILAGYRDLAASQGLVAVNRGDASAALKKAANVIEAEFTFPYLAHAPMEPMNGVIERKADGSIEAWGGFQVQTVEQAVVAAIMGVTPDKVSLNTVWAGGSFGRRATPGADWIAEAAMILKAIDARAPVHLVWTREDDMTGGYYRPMVYHRIRAGLDPQGNLSGWDHVIVGKSILIGSPFEAMLVKDGVDSTTVEGVADTSYALPDFACRVHNAQEGTPVLWWRSVGHTHTAQAMEVMIDDLAAKAGQDAVEFRLALLKDAPRERAVLQFAAEKARWGSPMPKGRGRGVAVHESFDTHVAMIAEVTVREGRVTIDQIVAAVDCGIAVNPDVIAAQIEGSVGFALSSVLRNRLTTVDGVVQETNYDTFEPTRLSEMPQVEVHIVPSTEAPSGIGEPGVPVLGPAIANAIFAATGKRLRSLPLDLSGLGA